MHFMGSYIVGTEPPRKHKGQNMNILLFRKQSFWDQSLVFLS
jgi:hypothetical protein